MIDRKAMPARNVFVVFEGLSGSGKTTIGRLVAEKIGAEFYKTPAPIFNSIRDEIDRDVDDTARLFFYLAGVIHASAEIAEILRRKSVVCDRYLLTTLCYHRALGVPIEIPDFVFAPLAKPDYTFLTTCEEKKRIQRLYERGLSYNDTKEQSLKTEQKFLAEYRKYHLIEIDNSSDVPTVAAGRVLGFLQG